MSRGRSGGLWGALAWLVFPAVPVLLESAYNGAGSLYINPSGRRMYPDPHDWNWFAWLVELGPLVGFGFLAGATLALPDEPTGRRGPRGWLSRRSVWVAAGPWAGFLVWAAVVWAVGAVEPLLPAGGPPKAPAATAPARQETWVDVALLWSLGAFVVATLCYGWLVFTAAAVRRARRLGRAWESVRRGLAVAAAFVGSLFGSFWVVTEWWRGFFFDPRIVPVLLAGLSLALVSGCASPVSYGEVRRRELFHAMLLAWTVGLALLWRWWARPRPGPPD
jgi:hypothetical protein